MKKTHIVLLIFTVLLTFLSFFSIFAMNQACKINFEWYSQYSHKYSTAPRNLLSDDWRISRYPYQMQFMIINNSDEYRTFLKEHKNISECMSLNVLKDSVYIYCTFGTVYSPDYRIKVKDIVQVGNAVEIKISVNSPKTNSDTFEPKEKGSPAIKKYRPEDIVRIDKDNFFVRGGIWFIIKNQDGKVFYKMFHKI